MTEVATTKPAASFLGSLLDNKPSGAPQSAEVTTAHRTVTRVYPAGSQTKGDQNG
jgi:hypothetical protein